MTPPPRATGFLDRSVRVDSKTYRYQIYVPRDYDRTRKWPAILFLHGAGERGEDGIFSTAIALGNAIRRKPDRYPVIAVFPQIPIGSSWSGEMEQVALATLNAAEEEFSIDPTRVALTGISMGGAGAWRLALHHPKRFRVVAPICGWIVPPSTLPDFAENIETLGIDPLSPYESVARALKAKPIWITHGAKDTTVPILESRQMHQALARSGAPVKFTELPDAGHNSWDVAYANEEFAAFLVGTEVSH